MNAELVEALRVVIRGVPDTWDGVKQAKAVLAKAQGETALQRLNKAAEDNGEEL